MLDSELNPEAPEFHPLPDPEMTATIEEGYMHMNKATRTSNTFPIGASYNLFQTFTDFNVVICKLRKNVISQSKQIMVVELPSATLRCDDNESNTDKIVDANDSYLDRINVHIDTRSGENRPSAALVRNAQSDGWGRAQPAAWNRAPVLATIKVNKGSASLLGAKNIPRPQLAFKEPVDNSDKLFVPRIHDKPNGIKPLTLTVLYDDAGQPIGYEHPYKAELMLYSPPAWALAEREPPAMPPPPDRTPLTLVETAPQLDDLVRHLESVSEIAVDLEHHSYRTYQGITCLIQISTDEGGDFIVDALALRDRLHVLNHSFTDPGKVKVFHGAEHDVLWLQRDLGVYVVGMFDTQQAARLLRLEGLALKHLLHKYCAVDADKTYQLADWRMRPLPEELVQYARTDTHYLLYVWRRMRGELLQRDATLLRTAFHNSAQVAVTTYVKPTLRPDSHVALYARSGKRFTRAQLAALRAVWAWRDGHARALDESPAYLLPNHMALALAEALPRDLQGLRALAHPAPPFLNQHIDELHRIILACREIPEEPQVLTMPANMLAMVAPPPRDPLYFAHDLAHAHAHASLEEKELELAGVAEPDLPAFAAPVPSPWLTPPASPRRAPALAPAPPRLPTRKQSQLNAEAQTFVPPYDRYKMYRVLSQAEEMKALEEKEAKVAALGGGAEVIRDAVLFELRPRAAEPERPAASPSPAPPAATPARDRDEHLQEAEEETESTRRKRKRQERLDPRNGAETGRSHKQTAHKHNKTEGKRRAFDYKKANYDAFHRKPVNGYKQPKMK